MVTITASKNCHTSDPPASGFDKASKAGEGSAHRAHVVCEHVLAIWLNNAIKFWLVH